MEIKRNEKGGFEGICTMDEFVKEELSDEAKKLLKIKAEYEKKYAKSTVK